MLSKFAKIRNCFFLLWLCLSCSGLSAKKSMPLFKSSQEKNDVKLSIRSLSNSEKRQIFNCYSHAKMSRLTREYHGLEISIENKTKTDLVLSKEKISLPVESNLIIKEPAAINPMLIPVLTLLAATSLLAFGIGFAMVPSVVLGGAIGITALNLNTQGSSKASIKKIRSSSLDVTHPTLIPSFSKIQKLVFIKEKDIQKTFNLSLESIDGSQKILFEVNKA
jgi:hypothetical protein